VGNGRFSQNAIVAVSIGGVPQNTDETLQNSWAQRTGQCSNTQKVSIEICHDGILQSSPRSAFFRCQIAAATASISLYLLQ
jgi:hypothetical protein